MDVSGPLHLHLPLEILHHVVGQLDPVSLIALSHTSAAWRALISPTRHDFVQRLLALELLPEHGGMVPLFDEREQKLTPPWDSPEWASNKYACCGCMKLRSHMMFANRAILRRRYRKPPPGSVEAAKVAVTDWEPLELAARWRRIQERAAGEREEQRNWVQLLASRDRDRDLWQPVAHPFAFVPPREQDETDREAARYLVGTAREKRRCIECRHRLGICPLLRTNYEPDGVPFVISRQLRLQRILDWHFPGLFEPSPPDKLPRIHWRTLRRESYADHLFLSLYIMRCPSCGIWQEHSAFRQWSLYQWGVHSPELPPGPLLCNRCYLATPAGAATLAGKLTAAALRMLRDERESLRCWSLGFGWALIERDFHCPYRRVAAFSNHPDVGAEILGGLRWSSWEKRNIVIQDADIPDLRRRFERYRDFLYNHVVPAAQAEVLQSWFKLWVEDYRLAEALDETLGQQIALLESDPHLVLDYILEHDPYRI
ncbi:hypothetical protein C8A05DRAFT_16035 [Staphylotrichum tortipilum]|uniref:F-box domain-containing protein n=1 Tax=Staphylotrichum tortipilum TaxID=2831512 RepID=A0AAN6MJ28_9PEZI|nr:hypothetical protein C8A05DRAFT_16035 [Staphylotrichum longicolle]